MYECALAMFGDNEEISAGFIAQLNMAGISTEEKQESLC
ncbi:hypothetical protein SP39_10 [Salmonella phage 39]|nr:hypothetical protein SP39_10 [Salmonella phage 39]